MSLTEYTILLAEDQDDDVFMVERAFDKLSVLNPLQVVKDGEEAREYLAGDGPFADRSRYPFPCLVLLDLNLPKRTGLEVLEWLNGQPALKRTPVVVLTGSKDNADIIRAYTLGARAYLVKPVGLVDLFEMVKPVRMHWMMTPGNEEFSGAGARSSAAPLRRPGP